MKKIKIKDFVEFIQQKEVFIYLHKLGLSYVDGPKGYGRLVVSSEEDLKHFRVGFKFGSVLAKYIGEMYYDQGTTTSWDTMWLFKQLLNTIHIGDVLYLIDDGISSAMKFIDKSFIILEEGEEIEAEGNLLSLPSYQGKRYFIETKIIWK